MYTLLVLKTDFWGRGWQGFKAYDNVKSQPLVQMKLIRNNAASRKAQVSHGTPNTQTFNLARMPGYNLCKIYVHLENNVALNIHCFVNNHEGVVFYV